jgi:tetratricopeptide (TPR) repeat protein
VSSLWLSKGFREVMEDPAAWSRLLIRKFGLFLSSYEYGVIYLLESERNLSLVLIIQAIPAGLILALGGGGLWIALRRRKPGLPPLLLFLLSNLITAVLFFMASRFRLPFMAGLLPFAGYFLAEGLMAIRQGRLKGPALSLVGIGLFMAASFHLIDSEIRTVQYCRAQVSLSKLYLDEGNLKEARDAVKKSMARAFTPIAFYQLGMIEETEGNLIEAVVSYQEASRLDPRFIDAFTRLAEIHEREKEWEEAIEMRERIIGLVPGRFEAYYNLGLACANAGRLDKALQNLEQAAAMAPESPDAWEGLGKAYGLAGKREKAREALNKAISLDPARASSPDQLKK